MTPAEDDKEFKEEDNVLVLSDDDSEVKETNEGGEEVTGDGDEDFDGEEEEDDDEDEDEDDDDDEDDDEEEEDLGTEYLVKPVGEAEDEDDASDFNPEENEVEEDIDEEDFEEEETDDISNLSGGKSEPLAKRKRVAKDQTEPADVTAADDIRPSKR